MDLDKSLQLEAVYYSAPAPRSLETLVALGLVFDKIHVPGVYLPQGDYDRKAWQAEIGRIAALESRSADTRELLALMTFPRLVEKMPGFFSFDRLRDDPLDRHGDDGAIVQQIYEEMWGRPSEQFLPIFAPWHHKAVPDSPEHLTYPGAYYYQAGALRKASEDRLPLISDQAGIPIPGIGEGAHADAKALSAYIALQAMSVALVDVPLLAPEDIMEFRDANSGELRSFRRAMLRYAGQWRGKLEGLPADEIARETEFLVQTEIVPALDELRQLVSDPARPWHKRAVDGIRVTATIAGSCLTMNWGKALGELLTALAPQLFTELDAKGDKNQTLRRSDLYYLLKVQRAARS